jgi:ribonuclease inhibitor
MEKVIIDGLKMTSREIAHKYLAKQFDFPAYYGENLDALFDCLMSISSQTFIFIENAQSIVINLGIYGQRLVDTIFDAVKQNEKLLLINDKKEENNLL